MDKKPNGPSLGPDSTETQVGAVLGLALRKERLIPTTAPKLPHASSLPLCPRRVGFQQVLPVDRDYGFKGTFYSGIGTHLHTNIQKALAQEGLLFGNFSCCGVMWEDTFCTFTCPVCGRFPRYSEYVVKNGVSGRCDGIIPVLDAVLEVKTKGRQALKKMKEPDWTHWAMQASVYANALRERTGLTLKRIVLLYVSRESPRDSKVFIRPVIENIDQVVAQGYRDAMNKYERGELGEQICASAQEGKDMWCDYHGMCFAPDIDVQWERLLRDKNS